MNHDPRNVDAISLKETTEMIRLAGKTITCAWSIVTIYRKSTDDWSTIIVFFDKDNNAFAHAFEIETAEECEVMAQRLQKSAATMRDLEKRP